MENAELGGDQASVGEGHTLSVEQLMAKVEALQKTNERLIDEHRKAKQSNAGYRDMLDKVERQKLEADGDLSRQLEYERKRNSELEQSLSTTKQKTLKTNIYNTFLKIAPDVNDIDDLLNQPKFAHILKDSIDEENLTINEDGALTYKSMVLEAKPWLKKSSQKVGAVTTKPSFIGGNQSDDFKALERDELEKLIKSKFK